MNQIKTKPLLFLPTNGPGELTFMEQIKVRPKRYRPTKPHYVATCFGRNCMHKHYTPEAALKCLFTKTRDVLRFNLEVRDHLLQGVMYKIGIVKVDIHGQELLD